MSRLARPAFRARIAAPARAHRSVNTSAVGLAHDSHQAGATASPDARFEVVGSPFSLLSVSLSASQQLYTRRGTLVGLSGKAENAISTLSVLGPVKRAPVGIPFLYQKVASTTPVTALISTKSRETSIVTVQLDGTQDWVIASRRALLAWTGLNLVLKPQYNVKLGVANWGNTFVTGRGLLALAGSGQIYQVQLKAGENYVAHPSNLVAYSASAVAPLPFRFRSSNLLFQVPDLGFGTLSQRVKFFRVMSETATWRALSSAVHTIRTWLRRSIWGDRLFLSFEGPTTLLLQSRGPRPSDVLSMKDTDEIASSPPGVLQDAVARKIEEEIKEVHETSPAAAPSAQVNETPEPTKVRYATVRNGKVEFEKQ